MGSNRTKHQQKLAIRNHKKMLAFCKKMQEDERARKAEEAKFKPPEPPRKKLLAAAIERFHD